MTARERLDAVEDRAGWMEHFKGCRCASCQVAADVPALVAALRAVLDLAECDVKDEYNIFIYPATIRAAIDAHLGGAS